MTTFIRLAATAALSCVLAFAPIARAESPAPADPAVWGLFAKLAGTDKQAGSDGYRLHWRWEVPGAVLVQEFINPGTGKVAHTNTITPGPSPGTLHVKGSYLAGKEWDGTIEADGSVVLVGRGLLKTPHRMVLTADGVMEIRLVKMKSGRVVSESAATSYNRFTPVDAAGASATASASDVPADAQALGAPTPSPIASAPSQPRTAEELEAQAAALQEQAAALRRAQADAAEQDAGAAAQAEIAQLEQQASDAEARAAAAQRQVDEAKALAEAANPPKPKPRPWVKGADNRDWWSFCAYGVDGGDSFITQLIHQRIYEPYDGPREEYDAYQGPNRSSDVEARFTTAMQTSGLVPQEGGSIGINCRTFASRDGADWGYQQAQQQDPVPKRVLWLALENESIEGSLNLPTLEELNAMKRAAEQARVDAEVARSRAEGAAKLEAARAKSRKLKRDCEAGVPGACTASKQ